MSNISNPIDIGKLKSDIVSQVIAHVNAKTTETKAHVTTKSTSVKTLVSTENDATQETLGQLTTVNGQIDTNVQAVNAHVTAEISRILADIPRGSIAKVLTGTSEIDGTSPTKSIYIPPVNFGKAVVDFEIYGYQSATDNWQKGLLGAEITSATNIELRRGAFGSTIHIKWRVIDYV